MGINYSNQSCDHQHDHGICLHRNEGFRFFFFSTQEFFPFGSCNSLFVARETAKFRPAQETESSRSYLGSCSLDRIDTQPEVSEREAAPAKHDGRFQHVAERSP